MIQIEFYEDRHGFSEVWNWLEDLRIKGQSVKDARIQYKQVLYSIQLLADNGTMLPDTIVKHLDEDIWELRPGNNRVLFFQRKRMRICSASSFSQENTENADKRNYKGKSGAR